MKRLLRSLLALLIFSLLISACAVTARNALIGKWNNEAQGVTLEFTMDGHMRQSSQGVTQELGYQFLNDNSIQLLVSSAAGAEQAIPFTISGDTLTLDLGKNATTGQPQTLELQRVK